MSKIIAYSGAHGTGKTTAVLDRAAKLKREHPDKRIEIRTENLAFCPYPINADSTPDSQMWIFSHHLQSELHLITLFDLVVSDRSIIDVIAYTMAHGLTGLASSMLGLARHHMHHYQEVIITTNNHHHVDGMRDTDPVFRNKVEDELINIYSRLGYAFETDPHGNLNAVRCEHSNMGCLGSRA